MIQKLDPDLIEYPSHDGKPMAENTLQFEWISTVKNGIEGAFVHDPDVFVCGDCLWYPVRGEPGICTAPDTMVVFGRPKEHRLSYKQWLEGNIPPQVVFEILSPGNRTQEMLDKFDFYETYGVEEYYLYDPDERSLRGWIRQNDQFEGIENVESGWVSPRMGLTIQVDDELTILKPNGKPVLSYHNLLMQSNKLEQQTEEEKKRADKEKRRANKEQKRADLAEQLVEEEKKRADAAEKELQALRELLKQKGIDLPSM
jgi:Uma2 family endonuclease